MKPSHKQTEVGVIPEDWEEAPFKHVTNPINRGIALKAESISEDGSIISEKRRTPRIE
jgi:hypothetical protein